MNGDLLLTWILLPSMLIEDFCLLILKIKVMKLIIYTIINWIENEVVTGEMADTSSFRSISAYLSDVYRPYIHLLETTPPSYLYMYGCLCDFIFHSSKTFGIGHKVKKNLDLPHNYR